MLPAIIFTLLRPSPLTVLFDPLTVPGLIIGALYSARLDVLGIGLVYLLYYVGAVAVVISFSAIIRNRLDEHGFATFGR